MTTNIGSLAVSLSLDASNFNGSMAQVDRNLRAMGSELKAVRARGTEYGNSLEGLRTKQDILRRSMDASNIKLNEARRRYDEMVASGQASDAQLERQARRVNEAQAQYNRFETELTEVTNQYERLEREIEQTTQAANRQQTVWERMSSTLAPVGRGLTAIGQGAMNVGRNLSMYVTAPLVAMGTGAFKAAVDFESAFAGVRKTVDATDEEFSKLEQGIRDMAKAGPSTASELSAIAEAAGQLGIKTENILTFTSTMSDLGTATNMSSEQAATSLARLANITQMPQTEFDKLGSTIVALGNNMATTESEITEFGLRIAGAGAQVGLSEAQILSVGAALSSVGINAEAGGTAISKVMIELANNVASGGKELDKFAKVAGMSSKDFKKAFEEDAAEAIVTFIEGLGKMSESGENVFAIIEDLGLQEVRVRDALLRASGAGDLLRESLDLGSKAWEENTALTKEATERYKTTASQMKTLWNQIVDVGISLGNVLIPKVQVLMDKLKPLIARFAEMDEKSQNMVLTIGGVVAAIGPLLVVGGALMSGIGGTITVVSSLTGAVAGAGGLTAALTALSGPVGWTIAGIAGVAGAIVGVTAAVVSINKDVKKAKEVNLEHAESMIEQQKELDGLSTQYENLRGKSRLSNDEILRFRDIQNELKFAESAKEIKSLTDEQAKLLEKSGLTNEEMSTMLELNDNLIKLVPDVDKALSEHGNAVIGNAEAIGEANAKLKENIALELENQRIKADAKLEENIRNYISALDELKAKEEERNKLVEERNETEIRLAGLKIEAQNKLNEGKDREAEKTIDEIAKTEIMLSKQNDKISKVADEVTEKQKSVEQTEKEIEKTQALYDKMIDLHLEQVGINATGQEGIAQLDEAIKKTQTRISELNKVKSEQGSLNEAQATELSNLQTSLGQYRSKKEEIQKIQGEQATVNQKIDEGTGKAKDMTKELSKDTTKNVDIDDKGQVKNLNDEVSKAVTKRVTLSAIWEGITEGMKNALPFFAKGTSYAPGGLSVVGELGQELMHINGKMYLATGPSLVNLPRGAKVIPNKDTEAILRKWNIPMLANGGTIATAGLAYIAERGRELVDFGGSRKATNDNSKQMNNNINIYTTQSSVRETERMLRRLAFEF